MVIRAQPNMDVLTFWRLTQASAALYSIRITLPLPSDLNCHIP